MMDFKFMTVLLVLFVIVGCQNINENIKINEHDLEKIEQLWHDAVDAVKAGDLDKYMDLHDDNVIVMWPNQFTFTGKEAVRSWFERQIFASYNYLDITHSIEEVEICGDRAFIRGVSENVMALKTGGESWAISSKFIEILKRQDDGSWKYWRKIFNMNPAETG